MVLLFILMVMLLLTFHLQVSQGHLNADIVPEPVTQEPEKQQEVAPPTFPPAEHFCTNQYCLADDVATRISATSSVQLNKYSADRPHPAVVKFTGEQPAYVHAKFRSLSARNMAMYWDDGKDGVYKGILRPGQTTQSNSYIGHRFFFTEEKDKTNVIGTVTINKDVILNVIRDSELPLSDSHPVMEQTMKEEAYDKQYMADNEGLRYCYAALLYC